MKFAPFSSFLCQTLLDKGYLYFVVPDDLKSPNFNNILTYQAVKDLLQCKTVPIKQMMGMSNISAEKYYIMYLDHPATVK